MGFSTKKDRKYTYVDYLTWNDDERWELIGGVAYNMTPAPNRRHQEISRNLLVDIAVYLKDKTCKLYSAPFDVRLPLMGEKEEDIVNVVQPDIVIVCDKNKLDDNGCIGAPDVVVEIISASTSKKDLNEKFNLYEKAGVEQYWVVYPFEKEIYIYQLIEGKYDDGKKYSVGQTIQPEKFEGLAIDLKDVFRE